MTGRNVEHEQKPSPRTPKDHLIEELKGEQTGSTRIMAFADLAHYNRASGSVSKTRLIFKHPELINFDAIRELNIPTDTSPFNADEVRQDALLDFQQAAAEWAAIKETIRNRGAGRDSKVYRQALQDAGRVFNYYLTEEGYEKPNSKSPATQFLAAITHYDAAIKFQNHIDDINTNKPMHK